MAQANGNASGMASGSAPNGSAETSAAQPPEPPLSRSTVTNAMEAALGPGMEHGNDGNVSSLAPGAAHRPVRNVPTRSPAHVHGSALEGGDSPAVLAQPASAASEGQGSRFHPDAASAGVRAKRVISGAQDVAAARYRRVTEGTDDFVHDNPWKAITMAAIGGLIVGLLISR
nr:DUF883 domain-containing protein [Caballeronia sp. ATUFL_M2_KS44]